MKWAWSSGGILLWAIYNSQTTYLRYCLFHANTTQTACSDRMHITQIEVQITFKTMTK